MTDDCVSAAVRKRDGIAALALPFVLQAALVVTWSGGFIGMRFAINHAPLVLVLLWRSLASGLLLLPFALTIGPRLGVREMLSQALFGVLAMGGYLGAFALALSYGVPTGLGALIMDMLPIVVALLSWPVLGQALTGRQWLGSCFGWTGVLIVSGWSVKVAAVSPWAYGLPALGTLSLAAATLLEKRFPGRSMPVHQKLCIQCMSSAAIFAVFASRNGGVLPVLEPGFIGGILWLVLVATLGSWGLYYLALRKSSAARVTAVLYLSPPIVMIWAWVMFGEPLSWAMAAGLIVSLLGIGIIAGSPSAAPSN